MPGLYLEGETAPYVVVRIKQHEYGGGNGLEFEAEVVERFNFKATANIYLMGQTDERWYSYAVLMRDRNLYYGYVWRNEWRNE